MKPKPTKEPSKQSGILFQTPPSSSYSTIHSAINASVQGREYSFSYSDW